ncbi:putative glycosyltransferase At5g03795 isoform X1 [Apium graveolens]|uniref:putative glycosyltransferase At5g03795 isoform X1 n=2 Tax=Apium graveolens TaxID=4045 RepID=UPI003D78DF5E
MRRSLVLIYSLLSRRRLSESRRSLFFFPTSLALVTSLAIIFYISSTSNLFTNQHPPLLLKHTISSSLNFPPTNSLLTAPLTNISSDAVNLQESPHLFTTQLNFDSTGNNVHNEVFHDRDIFMENYKEMNRSFKIYIYPHSQDDPFANVLLPVDFEPRGNYASESYFKKVLVKSHFITEDPLKADLFFLPFSIARLRHDPRVGINGIQDFIRDYIFNISHSYPFWNRTGGADHFYVACHSIGRSAMDKADEVKLNSIQVVCSSSYFLSAYFAHKDVSVPQIWPRQGEPPRIAPTKRKRLVFFAGSINSPVREKLVEVWGNDSEISVHSGHLKTPYAEELLRNKFCLHVKGFEVNTARVGDALYYGCVPVIIANHYDLPFADILNWKSFSVIIATLDIPLLKQVLKGITFNEYLRLHSNVLKVRKHFQWHTSSVTFDAFDMVMYDLWLRRSSVRVQLAV